MFASTVPCIPNMPSHCGSDAGNAPRPINASVQGTPVTREPVRVAHAPAPEFISRRRRRTTRAFSLWRSGAPRPPECAPMAKASTSPHGAPGGACEGRVCDCPRCRWAWTSLGTSISTGPGRSPPAIANALRSVALQVCRGVAHLRVPLWSRSARCPAHRTPGTHRCRWPTSPPTRDADDRAWSRTRRRASPVGVAHARPRGDDDARPTRCWRSGVAWAAWTAACSGGTRTWRRRGPRNRAS